MSTAWTLVESPVDPLLLTAGEEGLTGVWFSPHKGVEQRLRVAGDGWEPDDDHPVLRAAAAQLGEYFAGGRREFDLPLAPSGTDFQQRVWSGLRTIAWGETLSYGALGARIGLPPSASRAVGLANGANPLSIVVPCHRVIGADGSLTGFGGGLERKRVLLDLESDLLF